MTYKEWAKEYDNSANILYRQKQQLQKAAKNASFSVLQNLKYRIAMICAMRKDCMDIAAELRKKEGEV